MKKTVCYVLAITTLILLTTFCAVPGQAETKSVTFTVKSSVTHVVSGATITFAGGTKTTGLTGRTEFTGIAIEPQDYSCSAPGYSTVTGQVSSDERAVGVSLSKDSAPLFSGLLGLATLLLLASIALITAYNRRM